MTDNASRKRNAEGYEPRFDVDLEYGKQAELFVTDVIPTQLLREFLRPANKPEAGNHRDDIRRKQLDHMRKKLERGSHPTKGFAIPLVTLFAWLKEHQQNVRRGVA